MQKYKVGDEVIITGCDGEDLNHKFPIGARCVIISGDHKGDNTPELRDVATGSERWCHVSDFTLVTSDRCPSTSEGAE